MGAQQSHIPPQPAHPQATAPATEPTTESTPSQEPVSSNPETAAPEQETIDDDGPDTTGTSDKPWSWAFRQVKSKLKATKGIAVETTLRFIKEQ